MPKQRWSQAIISQQGQGTFFNTFTTAKSVLLPQAVGTLPSQFFETPGDAIRVEVRGAISNIVTTPGTMALQVMIGSVIAFTTGNIQLNATAHTKLPFRFTAWLTARAVGGGTSAQLQGFGEVAGVMFTATAAQVDGVNTQTILQVPATSPALGTGFDSTIAQTIDLFAAFSISNAGNGIQIEQYEVHSVN
jgi:hypothetical protein